MIALGPKRRLADRVGAGLLGVVDEVALGAVRRVVADDLDGVLVGADGAVGAEAVEEALDLALGRRCAKSRVVVEAEEAARRRSTPTEKWFLGAGFLSSSKTALAMVGVNSAEPRP